MALLSTTFNQSHGQQINNSFNAKKNVKAGDKMPDYTLINLINHPTRTARISDFKGKLLILDFWSNWCGSCIGSWPKLMELQKQYKDQLQIILINPLQDESVVRESFAKRKSAVNLDVTLPTVCKDSAILELFPVSSVPHIVWIDQTGTVISITDGGALNAKNIAALLNKQPVKMVQKFSSEQYIAFDANTPIFINGNGGTIADPKNVLGQSILTKGREEIFPTIALVSKKEVGYYAIATLTSIEELYRLAYGDKTLVMANFNLRPILPNRILIKAKDVSKFFTHINGEIQLDNIYNYHLISKPASLFEIKKMMQEDLKRYFGLKVIWQRMKKKCLVLKAPDTSLISYKGGVQKETFDQYNGISLNKVPISYFIENLEMAVSEIYSSPYPIIDETGFIGLLGDFVLRDIDAGNLESLNRGLNKYKMKFTLEDRTVNVLVISDF
jgi:thiol-disulfide isomerase/thioredoxin